MFFLELWKRHEQFVLATIAAACFFFFNPVNAASEIHNVTLPGICNLTISMEKILLPQCAGRIRLDHGVIVLRDFIGRGSYSTVLLGDSIDLGRVAVKVFHAKDINETHEDYMSRIAGEYDISSSLHHPNIIQTVALRQEGLTWLLVVEYCPWDLMAAAGYLDEAELLMVFYEVLKGVEYLHSHGIAHLDLKIANILISSDGHAKISDFGSAMVFHGPDPNTIIQSSGPIGTEMYLAPEVYEDRGYDPRPVDTWALAVMFCYLHLPEEIPWDEFTRSNGSFPQFLSASRSIILSSLPKPAQHIVAQMLLADPTRRPTISQVLEDEWVKSIGAQNEQVGVSH